MEDHTNPDPGFHSTRTTLPQVFSERGGLEAARMVGEVVVDEGGDEVVAVVIPRLQAVGELDAAIRADLPRPELCTAICIAKKAHRIARGRL